MGRSFIDKQNYYEAYNDNGELVAYGTASEVAKVIGGGANSVVVANCNGCRCRGFEIINPAIYRRTFDCYHNGVFVCSGTYEEIAKKTGLNEGYVRYISKPSTKKKIAERKCEESKALILFEVEERRLEWLR